MGMSDLRFDFDDLEALVFFFDGFFVISPFSIFSFCITWHFFGGCNGDVENDLVIIN